MSGIKKCCLILFLVVLQPMLYCATAESAGTILFTETFDDGSLASKGWYDNTNLQFSTAEHIPGSAKSLQFRFPQGATQPTTGGSIRRKFTASDSVYFGYWVKYSTNWTGSNKSYHPHELYLLTNKNGDYDGLSYTYLTVYVEQNEGEPLLQIQDSRNIDQSRIGQDLVTVTENRAVAGCNGDSDGYGAGSCYLASPGQYWNDKVWRAGKVYFSDSPGPYYKSDWHFVEAYVKLNSISGGKAVKDGVLRYWFDGSLIIDRSGAVFRTGQYPDMKFNQFIIAPYIGDGSPVDQTFWVDDLTLATDRPESPTPPPPGTQPSPPTGLRIVEP